MLKVITAMIMILIINAMTMMGMKKNGDKNSRSDRGDRKRVIVEIVIIRIALLINR